MCTSRCSTPTDRTLACTVPEGLVQRPSFKITADLKLWVWDSIYALNTPNAILRLHVWVGKIVSLWIAMIQFHQNQTEMEELKCRDCNCWQQLRFSATRLIVAWESSCNI